MAFVSLRIVKKEVMDCSRSNPAERRLQEMNERDKDAQRGGVLRLSGVF